MRSPSLKSSAEKPGTNRIVVLFIEVVPCRMLGAKFASQKTMQRLSCSGRLPAIGVTVALLALEPNELGLGTLRPQGRGQAIAVGDGHLVVTSAVYREDRNVGARERHRRDIAQVGVGPRAGMTHQIGQ